MSVCGGVSNHPRIRNSNSLESTRALRPKVINFPFSFRPFVPIQSRQLLTPSDSVKHFRETMKTASVRDIRQNFPAVMRWIEEGENVAITMRRKIVARLIPERAPMTRTAAVPDFDLISKRIFGAKKFRGNLVNLEREGYES